MTEKRLEQVRKAVQERVMPESKKAEYARIFEIGANWADEHPINPWKNVNDELPKDHEKIFFRKKDGQKYYGWFDERMQCFLTIDPSVTKWTINGITHWMQVPGLPADILNP